MILLSKLKVGGIFVTHKYNGLFMKTNSSTSTIVDLKTGALVIDNDKNIYK